jgi:hypothetical protein
VALVLGTFVEVDLDSAVVVSRDGNLEVVLVVYLVVDSVVEGQDVLS